MIAISPDIINKSGKKVQETAKLEKLLGQKQKPKAVKPQPA
jgi:hypothetical protein